jgi:SAM-dependent methyltransferase
MAEVTADDIVYDLGCGDGRIVLAAARMGARRTIGIDLDSGAIAIARRGASLAGIPETVVTFIQDDLFSIDLSPATVICLYLGSIQIPRLLRKLLAELRPGTRIVSHSFDLGDWRPVRIDRISQRSIFLWKVPMSQGPLPTWTRPSNAPMDFSCEGLPEDGIVLNCIRAPDFTRALDTVVTHDTEWPCHSLAHTVKCGNQFAALLENNTHGSLCALSLEWSFRDAMSSRSSSICSMVTFGVGLLPFDLTKGNLINEPRPLIQPGHKYLIADESGVCASRIRDIVWRYGTIRINSALDTAGRFVGTDHIGTRMYLQQQLSLKQRLASLLGSTGASRSDASDDTVNACLSYLRRIVLNDHLQTPFRCQPRPTSAAMFRWWSASITAWLSRDSDLRHKAMTRARLLSWLQSPPFEVRFGILSRGSSNSSR